MRLTKLVVFCALALSATAANAGWYAGPMLLGGFSDNDNYERDPVTPFPFSGETDTAGVSGGVGALAGYDFSDADLPFSVEIAGNYRFRHDMNIRYNDPANTILYGEKSNVQTADFIVSALYDLPLGWDVQPYIGGGAGVAHIMLENEVAGIPGSPDSSNTNFAWQAQGGLKYPVGDGMKLRFDYRYIDYGRIETSRLTTGDVFSADLTSHDLRLGLTWDF